MGESRSDACQHFQSYNSLYSGSATNRTSGLRAIIPGRLAKPDQVFHLPTRHTRSSSASNTRLSPSRINCLSTNAVAAAAAVAAATGARFHGNDRRRQQIRVMLYYRTADARSLSLSARRATGVARIILFHAVQVSFYFLKN